MLMPHHFSVTHLPPSLALINERRTRGCKSNDILVGAMDDDMTEECANRQECYTEQERCDGWTNCMDGSDESGEDEQ